MPKLLVRKAGTIEREISLEGTPIAIGRSADNDLVLLDVSVSRRHARIEPTGRGDGAFRIVDLGSGNGIMHLGDRVKELVLYPGCIVALGDYLLEVAGEEDAVPLSEKAQAKLVLIGGGERRSQPLAEGETRVGRSTRADLSLDEPLLSGEHFKIVARGDVFALVDLDSANGTFVNGVRVRERELVQGDQIRVAGMTFYFAADGVEPEPGTVELIEPVQTGSMAPSPPPSVPPPLSSPSPPPPPPRPAAMPTPKTKAKAPRAAAVAGAESPSPSPKKLLLIGALAAVFLFLVVVVLFVRSSDDSTEREFQEVFQANLTAEARERIESYAESAADYESRGNLELALEQYRKILALEPTHQQALAETARLEETLELDAAERARRQQEQSERLARVAELAEQAEARVANGDFGGARELLAQAQELSPDSSLVEARIVASYVAEGNYQRRRSTAAARAAFEKALELDPANTEAKRGIASIDASRQASRQQQNRVEELTETGLSQLRREEFRDAYQTFGEVLRLDPSNARAKEFRDQASELLEQQVRPMYDEGVRLFNAGDLAAAMAQFQRVRDRYPDHPDTRAFLSREMDKVREEAVERYKRAYIYEGLGRLREALVLYREALALLPDPREEYHQKAAERIAEIERKLP